MDHLQNAQIVEFGSSALYALASGDVPQETRERFIAREVFSVNRTAPSVLPEAVATSLVFGPDAFGSLVVLPSLRPRAHRAHEVRAIREERGRHAAAGDRSRFGVLDVQEAEPGGRRWPVRLPPRITVKVERIASR